MLYIVHGATFLLSLAVIWVVAGLLVESVHKVAKRFHRTDFTVSFFVLGFLTSISEVSVMVNSTLTDAPQISAGNLAGASIVILFFLMPFLAIAGNGVKLTNTLSKRGLFLSLIVTVVPLLLMLDGTVSVNDGITGALAYGALLFLIRKKKKNTVPEIIKIVEKDLIGHRFAGMKDIAIIVIGAIFIFFAARLLVSESLFFSDFLGIPPSIIGLLILSIGTNIPELVIAVRSIGQSRKSIAFGNYLGSILANTLIFAFLAFMNGPFAIDPKEFVPAFFLMSAGAVAFYKFALSENTISRREGILLILIYIGFFAIQAANTIHFIVE